MSNKTVQELHRAIIDLSITTSKQALAESNLSSTEALLYSIFGILAIQAHLLTVLTEEKEAEEKDDTN